MNDEDRAAAALEKVDEGIKEFAQARADLEGIGQVMVSASVIMYEIVNFEDGENTYRIRYAFPFPMSLTSAAGVVQLGALAVESDLDGMMTHEEDENDG